MNFDTWSQKAYQWLIHAGPKLLIGIVLLLIGFWVISLIKRWIKYIFSKKDMDNSLRPFLLSLITVTLQAVLILTVMQSLGVKMTIFAALIGAMGVAFGLALSGTLQNFTSGILILLLKPYRVGDSIVAQGQDGIVRSIQLFHTIIITTDNRMVIIPNSKLSNEVIVNISKMGKRRLDIEFKFNFGFEFDKIRSIILKSLTGGANHINDAIPAVGISSIDPDGFKVMVHIWVKWDKYEASKFEVQQKLIHNLKQEGIKLPGM